MRKLSKLESWELLDFIEKIREVRRYSTSLGIESIGEEDALIIYSTIYSYASYINSEIKALDAGAGIGYSTLWIAKALEDSSCISGEVLGLEVKRERYTRALEVLKDWKSTKVKISFLNIDALEYIESLEDNSIDIAFIDVNKQSYLKALQLLRYKLKVKGLAVFHNAYDPPPPVEFLREIRKRPWNTTAIPTSTGGLLITLKL